MCIQRTIFGFILNKLINQNVTGYLLTGREEKPRSGFVQNSNETFYVLRYQELGLFLFFCFLPKKK